MVSQPAEESRVFDIAVIGAGAAGLGAASFLSGGASVLVLEREAQPAYHSSGRSAAVYIEGYENPDVARITSAGKDFFFNPPAEADVPLVHARGGLTVAGPGETDALNKYLQVWQPICQDLAPIGHAEALEMVNILRPEWLSGALYDPTWQSIDVHALLTTYQRMLRSQAGSLVCNATVTALTYEQTHESAQGKRWRVDTTEGVFQATTLINAAGAWAGEIGKMAGLDSPRLHPLRRTAVLVPAPQGSESWPLVHTIKEELYFKPESPGLMLSPQDETPSAPTDAAPDEIDVATAIDHFQRVTHFEVNQVLHSWAGLRTFTADRRPVIGRDPANPEFVWLCGQGGFGIQTSPGLSGVLADHLLRDKPVDKNLSIERFG